MAREVREVVREEIVNEGQSTFSSWGRGVVVVVVVVVVGVGVGVGMGMGREMGF